MHQINIKMLLKSLNKDLSAAQKIIQGIKYSNIKYPNNNTDPKYYLSKSFQNSFPNITFKKKWKELLGP
jgi:hypothetical protein